MGSFCTECGHQLKSDDNVCVNCGNKINQPKRLNKNKKKEKIYFGVTIAIIAILVSFSMWANSYYSQESTSKRFTEAISEKNVESLTNLIIHQDGSEIIPMEAEALVKLIVKEGKRSIEDYFSIQPDGKFLGIFQKFKVEMVDQFAYVEGPVEPLSFLFNKERVKEEDRGEDFVVMGPLTPGIYDIETKFENEFGSGVTNTNAYLWDALGEPTWIPVELPFSEVVFNVENYSHVMKKASIFINETEVSIDSNGTTEPIGPIMLDGTQKAKVVVEYPWGKVESESIEINSDYQYLKTRVLSKEQETEIAELLLQFGEELAKAQATNSIDVFTNITEDNKEIIQNQILNGTAYNSRLYSGQLEEMSMNAENVNLLEDIPGVNVNAEYLYNQANYYIEDTPEFVSKSSPFKFELKYEEHEKKWLIQSEDKWNTVQNPTHVLKGSNTLYEPDQGFLKTAKEEIIKEEIDQFMEKYLYASVDAINYNSISYVDYLMTKDGPAIKETEDYIASLKEKGITEELLSTSIEKVEETEVNVWQVTYIAEYRIIYPDKEAIKKFNTVSIVKKVDAQWLADEMISTKEI